MVFKVFNLQQEEERDLESVSPQPPRGIKCYKLLQETTSPYTLMNAGDSGSELKLQLILSVCLIPTHIRDAFCPCSTHVNSWYLTNEINNIMSVPGSVVLSPLGGFTRTLVHR